MSASLVNKRKNNEGNCIGSKRTEKEAMNEILKY